MAQAVGLLHRDRVNRLVLPQILFYVGRLFQQNRIFGFEPAFEGTNDVPIELGSFDMLQMFQSLLASQCPAVRLIVGQRIVSIRDCQDSRPQMPPQTPPAIARHRRGIPKNLQRRFGEPARLQEDLRHVMRGPDQFPLIRVQSAGLLQNMIGQANLPEVVQQCRQFQMMYLFSGPA